VFGVTVKTEQVPSSVGHVEVVVDDPRDWSVHDEFKGLHVRLAGVRNEISGVVQGTILQIGGTYRGTLDLRDGAPMPKPLVVKVKIPRAANVKVDELKKR
jgi:hypothetical protein